MALISCPECSREISDKVKACPNCGYPLSGENMDTQKVELTSVNVKIEEEKKKKIIKLLVSIVVIATIIGGGFFVYSKKQAEKAAHEYTMQVLSYKTNIDVLMISMMASGAESEDLMNLTSRVWYNTIYEKRDSETDKYTRAGSFWVNDFNDALANLFDDNNIKTKISNIKSSQDSISSIMKDLKNPPEEYNRSYETVLELYSAYQGITDLAINPKGSLNTFNENKNEKIDKFLELYNKLRTQLPE